MSERGASITMGPPPAPVLRVMNPLVRLVVLSPLGSRVGSLAVIGFRGRRSGRRIRIPVAFHLLDGVPYVFTDRPWRASFTGGTPVDVVHRGRRSSARATLLTIPDHDVGAMIRQALDHGEPPRALGMRVPAGHEPTIDELAALGQSAIRFDLG